MNTLAVALCGLLSPIATESVATEGFYSPTASVSAQESTGGGTAETRNRSRQWMQFGEIRGKAMATVNPRPIMSARFVFADPVVAFGSATIRPQGRVSARVDCGDRVGTASGKAMWMPSGRAGGSFETFSEDERADMMAMLMAME